MAILESSDREVSLLQEPAQSGSNWISIQDGDVHWKVHPDFLADFFEETRFQLENWKEAGSLQTIKSGPHRTVYRVQLDHENFYLKHYKTPDWKSRIQNLVRPSKSMLEWNVEKKIKAVGIPTIETVAIGQKSHMGQVLDNFLISKEIPHTETLQDYVKKFLSDGKLEMPFTYRKYLAKQMGHLIGQLHSGGFDHQDLHSGNILVRIDPETGIKSWIIDLHAIRCGKSNLADLFYSNLALFNNYFAKMVSRTDRRRFFNAYWKTIHQHVENQSRLHPVFHDTRKKSTITTIESYCNNALLKRYEKDDRKWERSHRKQVLFESKQTSYRALSSLGQDLIQSLVDQPEKILSGGLNFSWMKENSGIIEGIITLEVNNRSRKFWLFHTKADSTETHQAHLKLKNAWKNGQRIFRRSIDAIQPQFWLTKKTPDATGSWLLMDYDEKMVPVSVFLEKQFPVLAEEVQEKWLEKYLDTISKNLDWLFQCGFHYPQLTGDHLLVHSDCENCRFRFFRHEALNESQPVTWKQKEKTISEITSVFQKGLAQVPSGDRLSSGLDNQLKSRLK